jgi:hypothetical protein
MKVTVDIPKSVIDTIRRSAEVYCNVTPTDAQIKKFLTWHVEGIYVDFHGEDMEDIVAEDFG